MELINNPWVTGIGGGLVSSLIVFFLTRYFLSKKENREYNQKVRTANNELLYSIRPHVVDKELPTKEMVYSLKSSIARKYEVSEPDLFSEYDVSSELTNEIMSNSFLSSGQKLEFCSLANKLKELDKAAENENVKFVFSREGKGVSPTYVSTLLATMIGATATILVFINEKGKVFGGDDEKIIPIILISTGVPLLVLIITMFTKNIIMSKAFNPKIEFLDRPSVGPKNRRVPRKEDQ